MATTKKPRRADVLSLLDKLEAEYTTKISLDRAIKKLQRHIAKKGVPTHIIPEEQKALEILGLAKPEPSDVEPEEEAKKPAKKKSPAKKPAPAKKAPRLSWIEAAAKAVLTSKTMTEAAEKTAEILTASGKELPKSADYGTKLHTRNAASVLIMVGKIEVDKDGNIKLL